MSSARQLAADKVIQPSSSNSPVRTALQSVSGAFVIVCLTLSLLNSAMLSHSSVYPARPPRPPFVAPRVCVVLRGISRCLAPDILRALAGEHSGACGRLAVLSRLGH